MATIFLLLAVVLTSAVVGLAVYWPLRRARVVFRVLVGLFFGLSAMLASALILLNAALKYPGYDSDQFYGLNRVSITRDSIVSQYDKKPGSIVKLILTFPSDVRKGDDFPIRLSISAYPELKPGDYRSSLSTARIVEVRPHFTCAKGIGEAAAGEACSNIPVGDSGVDLAWEATPISEARPRFVITLPIIWDPRDIWIAHMKFGDKDPTVCSGEDCYLKRSCEQREGICVLDAGSPRFVMNDRVPSRGSLDYMRVGEYDGIDIDLAANTISFPIQITTTLGLNIETYGWLAVAGTIASGMLGSGWAWKLLDGIKMRRQRPSTPQSSSEG